MDKVGRVFEYQMPDANLLEITDEDWTLLYRDRGGKMRVLGTGKY